MLIICPFSALMLLTERASNQYNKSFFNNSHKFTTGLRPKLELA